VDDADNSCGSKPTSNSSFASSTSFSSAKKKHASYEMDKNCVSGSPKSIHSLEIIREYVKSCIDNGQNIINPEGLSQNIYQTGLSDTPISNFLKTRINQNREYIKTFVCSQCSGTQCYGETAVGVYCQQCNMFSVFQKSEKTENTT
jgi:hypothetical protein